MSKPYQCTYLQHPFNGDSRRLHCLFIHLDLRLAILHAQVQFLERIQFHVRAVVACTGIVWRGGYESLMWGLLDHLVEDSRLCGDDKAVSLVFSREMKQLGR